MPSCFLEQGQHCLSAACRCHCLAPHGHCIVSFLCTRSSNWSLTFTTPKFVYFPRSSQSGFRVTRAAHTKQAEMRGAPTAKPTPLPIFAPNVKPWGCGDSAADEVWVDALVEGRNSRETGVGLSAVDRICPRSDRVYR